MKIRNKILIGVAALLTLLLISSILIVRSARFSNFVREKVIAVVEESTGGTVEISSFTFDWTHLTVRIRDFILHGREPRDAHPLVRIPLLELRLKLLAGFKKAVDLRYLGLRQPQVNLIVFPDGTTNIPRPRVHNQPSEKSRLETVVDLAVQHFEIENGLIEYAQQKSSFSARGENLRALLDYNTLNPSYRGNLSIDPVFVTSADRPPLRVRVAMPVTIEKDAVTVAGGKLSTAHSEILIDASLHNLKAPVITARVSAAISLPEMQRDFPGNAPQTLSAKLSGGIALNTNAVELQTADLSFGKTIFQAASKNGSIEFHSSLALEELSRTFKIGSIQPAGALELNGNAKPDARNNYTADGTLRSRGLSVRGSPIDISSPFHADPFLISLDGLKIDTLGGKFGARVFLENLRQMSVEGNLRNFSLPVVVSALTGKRLDYDGAVNGSITAKGDLNAYRAEARLRISPGTHGVPLGGQINADYLGSPKAMRLRESYLTMPHTRVDFSGSLNKQVDIQAVSHDLDDFLPAANFGAVQPLRSLPVALQGGTATLEAQVAGDMKTPRISGHLDVDKFAIERRSFDHLALDLSASPANTAISNGVITRAGLRSDFDASLGLQNWTPLPQSPLTANATVRNGELADLLGMASEGSIPASGKINADLHVHGTYGNPLGAGTFEIANGVAYEQPFDRLYANVNFADQLIALSQLQLDAAGGSANIHGTFQHPRDSVRTGHAEFHVATNNVQLANIKPLQQQNAGVAGLIELTADGAADLQVENGEMKPTISNIHLDLAGRQLRVHDQDAGNLTATARTANGAVTYDLKSNFAGSDIHVEGHTTLTNYATSAVASIRALSVEKALQIAGQATIPVRGDLSATAHFTGTPQAPVADLTFILGRGNVYEEPIDRLEGTVRYSNKLTEIPSLQINAPAGQVTLHGAMDAGMVKARVDGADIQIAKIEHVRQAMPGLAGTLHLAADVSASLREQQGKQDILIKSLNADVRTHELQVDKRPLGDASLIAKTSGTTVSFRLDSEIAQSQIRGEGQTQLTSAYPTRASMTFTNMRYANIAPFVSVDPTLKPAFDTLVEGKASLDGPLTDPDNLNARLQLDHLDFHTNPQGSLTGGAPGRTVAFQNDGPLIVALTHSTAQIQQFRIQGPRASIQASGAVNFRNSNAPLALKVTANADLSVLQDASRDFYSSGGVALDATIRGTFANPQVVGKLELKNANLNYADMPNGLANANGVILLNGTNASIQTLTAESGGGKITLSGFVGFGARSANYNLHATAAKVRTRYSGISLTSDATLSLVGNSRRSLLGGTVSIQRIAYSSSSDAGSILSSVSTPPSAPSAPSPLFTGMRLNVKVVTDPDLRVVTTYAERLEVSSNLTVRGTAATPGILGAVRVTNGQLVFFGNTYTVNTGTVNFSNPNAIEPVLNVSLQTTAQGVDVLLGVSGPMNNLSLTYHSDPPLTFQQIVQLLATNTTPADPTIAAHQPTPAAQSLSQMGESAVLGQAIANPLASRVQRVFGLTQFKIDPSVAGSNGGPSARVTLQQKIASNVTFTYITDVTQTNSQIVRVQWDFTPKFSAIALHDYNGSVSLQFLYKFKVR